MVETSGIKKSHGYKHDEIVKYFENNSEKLKDLEIDLVPYKPRSPKVAGYINFNGKNPSFNVPEFDFENNKPDIISFNENDSAIVIVEIKSPWERANHKTFGQILYYLTMAKRRIKVANEDRKVETIRGIILASKIDTSLERLIKEYEEFETIIPKIKLKTYKWTDDGEYLVVKDY